MEETSSPMFVDLDTTTGQPVPTTQASMSAAILADNPISTLIPAEIRDQLLAAVDEFALAYEQANAAHIQMFSPLTDDAFMRAMRAFEMALRDRLRCPPRTKLVRLLEQAMNRGLLPNGDEFELLYWMLRETRNAAAHAEGDRHFDGLFNGHAISLLIGLTNHLYGASFGGARDAEQN